MHRAVQQQHVGVGNRGGLDALAAAQHVRERTDFMVHARHQLRIQPLLAQFAAGMAEFHQDGRRTVGRCQHFLQQLGRQQRCEVGGRILAAQLVLERVGKGDGQIDALARGLAAR